MENIILRLLVSDNAVIQQATKELRAALKNPSSFEELCTILVTSKNPQIRQYAATLLRQRLGKLKNWHQLEGRTKQRLTQQLLNILQTEPEQSVVKILVQFIGATVKHDLQIRDATHLLEFIGKLCGANSDQDIQHKQRGYFILSTLSEEAPDVFSSVLPNIGAHVAETIQKEVDPKSTLMWHSLNTMKNLALHFTDDQSIKMCYSMLLPHMLKVLKILSSSNDGKAYDMLEMIDELLEGSIITSMPQIVTILQACMELANSPGTDETIKVKALTVLDTIVKLKKKGIIKHNLLAPILQTLLLVLKSPCDENLNYDNGNEIVSPIILASQVLDGLALNLPPSKLMPSLLEPIQIFSMSEDPNDRKAAFVIMGVAAEGCAEYICNKCFELFISILCKGLEDPVPFVRNAALYALGQFAEHLQPDLGKKAEQLMPVLFRFLEHIVTNVEVVEEKLHLDRVFYALEMFAEHSEKEMFLPFLPSVIASLLSLVKTAESSIHLKELALSAIGACASNAEDSISPFLPQIVECLSPYLVTEMPAELVCLQVHAIDTMATLARSVPPEKFQHIAQDCIRYSFVILENDCDPEVEGSIYGLFGAVSVVLKENMKDYIGFVLERMLKTLQSMEGILGHCDDNEHPGFPDGGDLSDSPDEVDLEATSDEEEDDDDDEGVLGYSVENVYLDKKVAACYAIKELALNTSNEFHRFLDVCFSQLLTQLDYPHVGMKKSALDALAQMCVTLSSQANVNQASLENSISAFIRKCAEIIHTCEEREVVTQALDSFSYFLKSAQNFTLNQSSHREAIFNCILDVFQKRTLCQLEEEEPSSEDEENAEQDELLIEYAGDVLPYFGRAMPPVEFKPYFITILPLLRLKMKKSGSVSQRSFAIGIVAECLEPLGPSVSEFCVDILPDLIAGVKDEHSDVRNNAIYGLGELLLHGKEKLYEHYIGVLQLLSECLAQESSPKVIDNICGAVARMILSNANLVPLDQVFTVIIGCLPLKNDFKENNVVMKCFMHLYERGDAVMIKNLEKIVQVLVHVLHFKQGEEDTLLLASDFFVSIKHDFPERITSLCIPPEMYTTYSMLVEK